VVIAGLGVVVLVGVLVLVWYWRRRRRRSHLFRAALADRDAVSILMHPNPDPDAMASAVAVAHLADHVDTGTQLQYPGKIQHQENRAFETVLDLDLERIESSEDLAGEAIVLVDHNEARGFAGAGSVKPYAVVDHHPGGGTGAQFTDVRTEYGACATILAEYFEELGATVSGDDTGGTPGELTVPGYLATALIYGIQSDTNRLIAGVSTAEFDACRYLYAGIDRELIDRIANPNVSPEVLEIKARAIRNRRVDHPIAVSNVERVKNADAIPQAADELIALEGVTTVVVYGFHDGTMYLSGRSRDDRIHMGKSLKATFEGLPMASAGGHARMGGGQVAVEHVEGRGPSEGMDREEFERKLFDALRGNL